MKYFGSTILFIRERNADIMRVFRSVIAGSDIIPMARVADIVTNSPASRFWVSPERAAIVISRLESGKPMPCMTRSKQEMFAEIFRRYCDMRSLYPGRTLIDLATDIVHQPAPKFYFTPRTMAEFINRIRRGFYDNHAVNNPLNLNVR